MHTLGTNESAFANLRFDPSTMMQLLIALMDRIECGVMACGPNGEVYHANAAAWRELAAARLLRMTQGVVDCAGVGRHAWAAALHDASVRQRSGMVSLFDRGERLLVALMPVNIGGTDRSAVVALMGRRSVCSPLGLEMLSNSHGLTAAERRVLRALIDNCSAREIAELHRVSLATVRTHIQAVRDKIGVRSIDALLLRAAEVPPVGARH